MKVTLRPRMGTVLIDPEMIEEYRGRIIIPQTSQGRDMPHIGTVVAMNGAYLTKKGVKVLPEFRPGSRVIFKRFSGIFVEIRTKRLIQVKMSDIEAVLT